MTGRGPDRPPPAHPGTRRSTTASDDEVVDAEVVDGPDAVAEAVDEAEADPLEVALAERDEYLDSLRRLQAEFENYKKRVLKQQTEQMARAAAGLVDKLLPVLDALDLATDHVGDDDSAEGKALVAASGLLHGVLAKEGLERIDPLGEEFDPNAHEAVGQVPAAVDAEPTDVGRAPGGPGHAGRLPLARHGGPSGHGAGRGLDGPGSTDDNDGAVGQRRDTWRPNANGSRRTTTRPSGCRARPPPRRSPAPTGSWPRSTTRTPTRATTSCSRRSPRPTTSWVTPTSARSTTRSAPWARRPAGSPAGSGAVAASAARAAATGWTTPATSATCSAGSSAGAAAAPSRPVPSAATTSRPSSI